MNKTKNTFFNTIYIYIFKLSRIIMTTCFGDDSLTKSEIIPFFFKFLTEKGALETYSYVIIDFSLVCQRTGWYGPV